MKSREEGGENAASPPALGSLGGRIGAYEMYEGLYKGPIIVNQVWAILTFSVLCITLALGFWGQLNGAWGNSKDNGMSKEDKNKFRTRMFILFVIFFILMFVGMCLFGFTFGDDSGPGSDFY